MTVRRTLPQRERSLVGAWCFADHFGPDDVRLTGGMDVAPHPHTGLQTVSWLFDSEIDHRDSIGSYASVRPGELNLMTAGRGISHSEVSTVGTVVLRGVQLWVALPKEQRATEPRFEHYVPLGVHLDGAVVRVFIGNLAGSGSPATVFTPLLGAEIVLAPSATVTLDVDEAFEHGVLVDDGELSADDVDLGAGSLGFLPAGRSHLRLHNRDASRCRLVLLGGEPFAEEIIMWWNFVGRSHEEIVRFRDEWEAGSPRFGAVAGYNGDVQRLPAPPIPNVRMRARRNA